MNRREFAAIWANVQSHWHLDVLPVEALDTYFDDLKEFDAAQVGAAVAALAREGKQRVPLSGQIRRKLVELSVDAPSWPVALQQLKQGVLVLDAWKPPTRCLDGNPNCDGSGMVEVVEEYELARRVPCECSPTRIDRARKMNLLQQGRTEACAEGLCDGSGFVTAAEPSLHNVARRCTCAPKLRERRQPPLHLVVRAFVEVVGWDEIKRMLHGDSTAEAQMRTKYEHVRSDQIELRTLQGLNVPGMKRLERAAAIDAPALPPGRPRGELEPIGSLLPTRQ